MSRIIGDERVIKAARAAAAGDKSVYINWDAIEELPDEYEAVVTEIRFDPKALPDNFSDVGNNTWMPSPALHYKIAEARGIQGSDNSRLEPIYEDVNISEMLMDDLPKMVNMLTGYRCCKQSSVIEEDGTTRRSSPCTIDYNVWNRCCEMWSKEESYSKGYTVPGKYEPKYDTKFKRKAHFYAELKFAMQKAETKAYEKTIRELAGLMTGYKTADLAKGSLVFAKIRRSRDVLRLETAARLQAISQGATSGQAQTLLFGPTAESKTEPIPAQPVADPVPEPEAAPRLSLLDILVTYQESGVIPKEPAIVKAVEAVVGWLKGTANPEGDQKYWGKAVGWLKSIETHQEFPPFAKIEHDFY
jgi:hypothetical protein